MNKYYLSLRITLERPVLLNSQEGDPNAAVSHDYIPGGVIRGLLIQRFGKSQHIDPKNLEVRRLFFSGETCFLNAYPTDPDLGTRTLPTPSTWQSDKLVPGIAHDHTLKTGDKTVQWQTLKTPYWSIEGAKKLRLFTPLRHLAVHIERSRLGQAFHDEKTGIQEGQIFRYESLAAGQVFSGFVLGTEDDCKKIESLLQDQIAFIGRSKSTSYGRVCIETDDPAPVQGSELNGFKSPASTESESNRIVAYLLSDLLLRDRIGQFCVDEEIFRKKLGDLLSCSLEPEKIALSEHVTGGFNGKWGLPLPQCSAFAKGSVVVYRVKGQDLSQLPAIASLGERQAEGFGRIVLHAGWEWGIEQKLPFVKLDPLPSVEHDVLSDDAAKKEATRLLKRLLGNRIENELEAAGQRWADDWSTAFKRAGKSRHPSKSQLMSLRQQIQTARYQGMEVGTKKLEEYLSHLSTREATQKVFNGPRNENQTFLDWHNSLLKQAVPAANDSSESSFWEKIGVTESNLDLSIGGVPISASWDQKYDSVLGLLSNVLGHIYKNQELWRKQ